MSDSQFQIEDGGNTLVLRVALNTSDPKPSASRKTLVVGSTGGFAKTGITISEGPLAGLTLSASVNVTVPRRTGMALAMSAPPRRRKRRRR
jgi:hypothetical protein